MSKRSTVRPSIQWWSEYTTSVELKIGEFVGQGRRLRHCGVTNTVLDRLEHPPPPYENGDGDMEFMGRMISLDEGPVEVNGIILAELNGRENTNGSRDGLLEVQCKKKIPSRWHRMVCNFKSASPNPFITVRRIDPWQFGYEDDIRLYEHLSHNLEKDLVKRPKSWWVCWMSGGVIVGISLSMAIMISFTTPTVGIGCRTLLWLVFWLLSSVSWIIQAIFQEPPKEIRWVSITINTFSFLSLLIIMLLQVRRDSFIVRHERDFVSKC